MKQIAISHIFTSNSLRKGDLKIYFTQLPRASTYNLVLDCAVSWLIYFYIAEQLANLFLGRWIVGQSIFLIGSFEIFYKHFLFVSRKANNHTPAVSE